MEETLVEHMLADCSSDRLLSLSHLYKRLVWRGWELLHDGKNKTYCLLHMPHISTASDPIAFCFAARDVTPSFGFAHGACVFNSCA
jgi:hypothetical protein